MEMFVVIEALIQLLTILVTSTRLSFLIHYVLWALGMSPHKLVLKENSPVILLRNLDPSNGLCNGTRLLYKNFMPNLILCEISIVFKGENVFIPRINLRPTGSESYPFQFQGMQFLLNLCFTMTINKSQGQALKEVGVYIREPCFSHGQTFKNHVFLMARHSRIMFYSWPAICCTFKRKKSH